MFDLNRVFQNFFYTFPQFLGHQMITIAPVWPRIWATAHNNWVGNWVIFDYDRKPLNSSIFRSPDGRNLVKVTNKTNHHFPDNGWKQPTLPVKMLYNRRSNLINVLQQQTSSESSPRKCFHKFSNDLIDGISTNCSETLFGRTDAGGDGHTLRSSFLCHFPTPLAWEKVPN